MKRKQLHSLHTMKGCLYILTASFLFGLIPSVTLHAYDGGITVLAMQSLKYLLVACILIPYSVIKYQVHRLPGALIAKLLFISGILYGAQAFLYAYAVTLMPVAPAALLLFTYPILVSLASVMTGEETISKKSGISLAGAFFGLCLLFGSGLRSMNTKGVACVLIAAACYALYILLFNRLTASLPAPAVNAFANAGPALSITLLAFASGNFHLTFAPVTWLYILFNAVGGGVIAYCLWFMGLKLLGPVKSSVFSMTEPAFAAVCSFVLLGQPILPLQALGGLVLLVSITRFELYTRKG